MTSQIFLNNFICLKCFNQFINNGLDARNPAFVSFDQVRLKPFCSATETRQSSAFLTFASLVILLNIELNKDAD